MSVADNLQRIRDQIDGARHRAGRKDRVALIAVSKRQPDELVREAFAAGQRDFGENYVQELTRKKVMLPEARWHAIGHVQRNKAKGAAQADVVHTIDSIRIAEALEKSAERKIEVLIEVNLAGEISKSGASIDEVPAIIDALGSKPHLSLVGLMCVPPPEESRKHFALLRGLRDRAAAECSVSLPHLSMGMSADFEDAIMEGATMVRIGTAIFGERSG